MEMILREGDFAKNLLSSMNNLRKEGLCCDVILKVADEEVYATKAVLASYSPYFKSMFSGSFREATSSTTEINLTGLVCSRSYLEQCIDALYTGKIRLDKENIFNIFHIVSYLTLDDLLHCCESFSMKTLDLDTVFDYYHMVKSNPVSKLWRSVLDVLEYRFHDTFVFDWNLTFNLTPEDVSELNSLKVFKYCTYDSLKRFLSSYNLSSVEKDLILSQCHTIQMKENKRQDCLFLVVDPEENNKEERPTSYQPIKLSVVIYSIEHRAWFTLVNTNFPTELIPIKDWKIACINDMMVFVNKNKRFGVKFCFESLSFKQFDLSIIFNVIQDPITDMVPFELDGNFYILAISSTLSNTSHMWIKKLKYFKMMGDFQFRLVADEVRHCHDTLDVYIVGRTNTTAYFFECGPPVLFKFDPAGPSIIRITVEESYYFDMIKEETEYFSPWLEISLPAHILSINNQDLFIVHDNQVMFQSDTTNRIWETVKSAATENNEDFRDENEFYTCRNSTIWKIGAKSTLCNYLVEQTLGDSIIKTYHPPPPYSSCFYFDTGSVKSQLLRNLKQASYKGR